MTKVTKKPNACALRMNASGGGEPRKNGEEILCLSGLLTRKSMATHFHLMPLLARLLPRKRKGYK